MLCHGGLSREWSPLSDEHGMLTAVYHAGGLTVNDIYNLFQDFRNKWKVRDRALVLKHFFI
jgi:hypothetical protein